MTPFQQLLSQLGLSGDAATVTAELNAQTATRLDSALKTSAEVVLSLGMTDARTALAGLQSGAVSDALLSAMQGKLNSTGLDFSLDLTQQEIDALTAAGAWSSAIGGKLKALGRSLVSPYENWAGVGQVAVQSDVAAALAAPPDTFSSRATVLSVNSGPLGTIISCKVDQAEVVNGAVQHGVTLGVLASAHVEVATGLTVAQQTLANAVLAAIEAFAGSF